MGTLNDMTCTAPRTSSRLLLVPAVVLALGAGLTACASPQARAQAAQQLDEAVPQELVHALALGPVRAYTGDIGVAAASRPGHLDLDDGVLGRARPCRALVAALAPTTWSVVGSAGRHPAVVLTADLCDRGASVDHLRRRVGADTDLRLVLADDGSLDLSLAVDPLAGSYPSARPDAPEPGEILTPAQLDAEQPVQVLRPEAPAVMLRSDDPRIADTASPGLLRVGVPTGLRLHVRVACTTPGYVLFRQDGGAWGLADDAQWARLSQDDPSWVAQHAACPATLDSVVGPAFRYDVDGASTDVSTVEVQYRSDDPLYELMLSVE